MLRLAGKFLGSKSGSLIPIFAIGMIPIIAAVGLSVDYTSAVTDRGNMQDALDAATLAIMTLPTTTTLAARQQALSDQFTANNGQGTATLNSFTIAADGTASASTSASYSMPTSFMQVARISTVPIGVTSSVTKTPALVQATFKIDKASGWWNKTIYLWGTQFGATTAQKLMQISYTYNGAGDPKGYGTTTVYTVNGSQLTQVQQQVCSTSTVSNFKNAPAGSIQQTSGNKNYLTTCTMTPANSSGAVIDVSQMNSLYLEMDVPSGNPTVLKSNDPTKSNYLFIGATDTTAVEMPLGQAIDIFTAVPCGQQSTQAWEDGGSSVPEPITDADFFYNVTGKCDFNQRPSQTVLTQ
ncbi:TadE/TadG family type IV pilus assembly protein [Mesorhizobium sp.]|uniref:TadE/TadG family type IV pilus assembly protein n=1 Tax=Mesorhizobium sp. TaxID=1871066 RepID=UPI003BAC9F75